MIHLLISVQEGLCIHCQVHLLERKKKPLFLKFSTDCGVPEFSLHRSYEQGHGIVEIWDGKRTLKSSSLIHFWPCTIVPYCWFIYLFIWAATYADLCKTVHIVRYVFFITLFEAGFSLLPYDASKARLQAEYLPFEKWHICKHSSVFVGGILKAIWLDLYAGKMVITDFLIYSF